MKYVLPGMGATSEMYSNEWKQQKGFRFLNWPEGFSGHTITALADRVIQDNAINKEDTIIGSSLGGIVACEISNQIDSDEVILLGSAINKNEISNILKILYPLIDYTPLDFLKKAAGKIPTDLAKMFTQSEAPFIRSMCKAIFTWDGFLKRSKLLRIHGKHDRVIPLPADTNVILEGGHLIAMTHAADCIQAIQTNTIEQLSNH